MVQDGTTEGGASGGGDLWNLLGLTGLRDWLAANSVEGTLAGLGLLLVLALIADLVARRILLRTLDTLVGRTKATWDDKLREHKVFKRLSHLAPLVVLIYGVDLVGLSDEVRAEVRQVGGALAAFVITWSLAALCRALDAIYSFTDATGQRSIKTYTQLALILVWLFGTVIIVATLMGTSPWPLVTGLGAASAILLLIFKDTILSFIASLQIASYDMVRQGDWIEMPSLGADGDVIEIGLHTVKVQNWNKTITTIPTHRLISDSFKNWRGMSEAGGRRIARTIELDMHSVRFLTSDEIERFGRIAVLKDYIKQKRAEIDEFNGTLEEQDVDGEVRANARHLTNIGTFRAYLLNYLKHHPHIHQQLTLLVRQMQPTAHGLPIQVYCFTSTTNWGEYEGIQADLFDHILAILPEFGLRVSQSPTGFDVREALAGFERDGSGDPDAPQAD